MKSESQIHKVFHALWTRAVGTSTYCKDEWLALEEALNRLTPEGKYSEVYTMEEVERKTSFSYYGGAGSSFETAAAFAIQEAQRYWAHDKHDIADALKSMSKKLTGLAEEERAKQREHA